MPETNLGPYTVKSHGSKLAGAHFQDWMVVLILAAMEGLLNYIEPFHRYVGKDMMTNLMYPFHEDSIPMWAVPILCILVPIAVFIIFYIKRRDVYDLHHAILGLFYACLITGVITDSIKDAVGRPRPNFYMRCFPTGKAVFNSLGDVMCYGDKKIIKEGYKSFPSGHTSWSFAGLGFLAWYLSGKIRVFDRRGHVAKLCLVLLPLLAAAFVGITRVDDYWHHWTDVFAGGLIGLAVSSIVYLILFPFPALADGWAPHAYFQLLREEDASSEAGDFQMQQAGTRPAHVASSDSPGMDAMDGKGDKILTPL